MHADCTDLVFDRISPEEATSEDCGSSVTALVSVEETAEYVETKLFLANGVPLVAYDTLGCPQGLSTLPTTVLVERHKYLDLSSPSTLHQFHMPGDLELG